jgi:hypothetical protein
LVETIQAKLTPLHQQLGSSARPHEIGEVLDVLASLLAVDEEGDMAFLHRDGDSAFRPNGDACCSCIMGLS